MDKTRPELELRLLWYFVTVAQHLHFGRAAEQLGIEQPPLSQQIQRLEALLGCRLFDRTSRRVRLTAAGAALLPEAHQLLAQSRLLSDRVRLIGEGRTGLLTVGFAASTLFTTVRQVIQTYRTRYPEVELRLRELSTAAQVEELRTGSIEVGFLREPPLLSWLVADEVIREEFVAVLPGTHPLAGQTTLSLAQLRADSFVLFPPHVAPTLYGQVQQLFVKAGFAPRLVQEALEWTTIVALVEAGLGVSVVPASFNILRLGQVKYLPLAAPVGYTRIVACYAAGPVPPLVEKFLAVVREIREGNNGTKALSQ
jgi:DNA-binding transcriptional LysR family regulator